MLAVHILRRSMGVATVSRFRTVARPLCNNLIRALIKETAWRPNWIIPIDILKYIYTSIVSLQSPFCYLNNHVQSINVFIWKQLRKHTTMETPRHMFIYLGVGASMKPCFSKHAPLLYDYHISLAIVSNHQPSISPYYQPSLALTIKPSLAFINYHHTVPPTNHH